MEDHGSRMYFISRVRGKQTPFSISYKMAIYKNTLHSTLLVVVSIVNLTIASSNA